MTERERFRLETLFQLLEEEIADNQEGANQKDLPNVPAHDLFYGFQVQHGACLSSQFS